MVAPAVAPGVPGMLEVIIDGEVGEPPPQPTANRVQARPSARALRIGSSGIDRWKPGSRQIMSKTRARTPGRRRTP
jgi:hypothetical protein